MADVAGEELKIDCNTSTTGADLLIGDDLQVVDEVWLKDTDGEWHFLTRTLEVLDELFNSLLFNSINGTILNGRLNIVSTDNLTLIVNLNNTETIFGRANDSVDLNQGTNATPQMNFITYQNPSDPILTVESTHPDKVPHAEVARGLLGSGANVYGSLTNELGSSDEFIVNVYHRMLEQGAIYLSGLFPSVSTTEVNISGGTYIIVVDTKSLDFNLSTSLDFFYVHQNGSFRQSFWGLPVPCLLFQIQY